MIQNARIAFQKSVVIVLFNARKINKSQKFENSCRRVRMFAWCGNNFNKLDTFERKYINLPMFHFQQAAKKINVVEDTCI